MTPLSLALILSLPGPPPIWEYPRGHRQSANRIVLGKIGDDAGSIAVRCLPRLNVLGGSLGPDRIKNRRGEKRWGLSWRKEF